MGTGSMKKFKQVLERGVKSELLCFVKQEIRYDILHYSYLSVFIEAKRLSDMLFFHPSLQFHTSAILEISGEKYSVDILNILSYK